MTKTKGFKYVCDENSQILDVVPSIDKYPAKSPCSFDGFPIYNSDSWMLNARGQFVFCNKDQSCDHVSDCVKDFNANFDSRPCAFFAKTSKGKILLRNGDGEDENGGMNGVFPETAGKTSVSFRCIAMLLNLDISTKKFIDALTSLKIIECTADTTNRNDKRLKKITTLGQYKKSELIPPQPGFTLMFRQGKAYWHRSGSCLFTANGKYFLIGQDEETYFGVELPEKANSIDEAYKVLTPKELLKRADWQRQGEWYIVPVKAEDVSNKNTSFVFLNKITEIGLPIDDPDSNIHKVVAEEIRIIGNQLYAFCGFVSHDEHAEVNWNGWATFIKNRAVRSVSVEGVD